MHPTTVDFEARLHQLEGEMENLRSIMAHVYSFPTDFSLRNIEISGKTVPLGGALGGDHLIFVDFKRRYDLESRIERARERGDVAVADSLCANRDRVGVLVADVCGHSMTDALLAAMLHQAFLTGVLYELDVHGNVTEGLFEALNTRFHRSSSVTKFLTMIYGEISEDGTFRFISAGHPKPLVFSAEFDSFVTIDPSRLRSFYPVGMFPTEGDRDEPLAAPPIHAKEPYAVNEVNLMGRGDILILATDGLTEHARGDESYAPRRLERLLRDVKDQSANDIVEAVIGDVERFASPDDDVSLVVVKKVH